MDLSPQAGETKAEMNSWDYSIIKRFCTAKEIINKMKRQSNDWEKILVNDISDKGLISKIYIQNLYNNKTKQIIWQKMGRGPEQTFLQRHIGGQQTHEKILNITSLKIKEVQIWTTMRYHLTSVTMDKIKIQEIRIEKGIQIKKWKRKIEK